MLPVALWGCCCEEEFAVSLIAVTVAGRRVVIAAPLPLADDLVAVLPAAEVLTQSAEPDLVLKETTDGLWRIDGPGRTESVERSALLVTLLRALGTAAAGQAGAMLSAAALGHKGRAVLILGWDLAAQTLLTTWGVDRGFSYLGSGAVCISADGDHLIGFAGPIAVPRSAADSVAKLAPFGRAESLGSGEWANADSSAQIGLVILASLVPGGVFSIRPAGPIAIVQQSKALSLRAGGASAEDIVSFTAMSRSVPSIVVSFDDLQHCNDSLDHVIRFALETSVGRLGLERLMAALAQRPPTDFTYPIPAVTARGPRRKLTIGMATYDDYDGVYFSVQALRLFHPEAMDDVELLVVDNHPNGLESGALKALDKIATNLRYVPFGDTKGSAAAKGRVFDEAQGDFVLCMDSHVLIRPGAIGRLLAYMEAYPDCADLLQGPMISDDLNGVSTHWDPGWSSGMPGRWSPVVRDFDFDGAPFSIPMMGLGLFGCRRSAWPGFNPNFRGFGGEEGYLHEKFRQSGAQTLCLPFLGWVHRFGRPHGPPHAPTPFDIVRNQLIGMREMVLSTDDMLAQMRDLFGRDLVDDIVRKVDDEFATGA